MQSMCVLALISCNMLHVYLASFFQIVTNLKERKSDGQKKILQINATIQLKTMGMKTSATSVENQYRSYAKNEN